MEVLVDWGGEGRVSGPLMNRFEMSHSSSRGNDSLTDLSFVLSRAFFMCVAGLALSTFLMSHSFECKQDCTCVEFAQGVNPLDFSGCKLSWKSHEILKLFDTEKPLRFLHI